VGFLSPRGNAPHHAPLERILKLRVATISVAHAAAVGEYLGGATPGRYRISSSGPALGAGAGADRDQGPFTRHDLRDDKDLDGTIIEPPECHVEARTNR
jgi:hypothetical protein